MAELLALGLVLFGWALISRYAARFSMTAPLAMMIAGALLTTGEHPVLNIDVDNSSSREFVEVTLAVLLFADATRVRTQWLRTSAAVPARLLLVGLPLTVAAGALAGFLLFPDTPSWAVVLIAAILTATDAALAAAVIADTRVPELLRRSINVESGLNDGFVSPFVLVPIALGLASANRSGGHQIGSGVVHVIAAVGAGVGVGICCGSLLARARRADWSLASAERIGLLMVPLIAYVCGILVQGNGFVAAFIAGIAVGRTASDVTASSLQLTEDVGWLLSAVVWFLFGTLIPDVISAGVSLRVIAYAVLSLTVVRMVPVAFALLGAGLRRRDVLFVGWIGPRGLASIVFGILAVEDLHGLPETKLIISVVAVTVVLSVLAHGLSSGPLAAAYGGGKVDTDESDA